MVVPGIQYPNSQKIEFYTTLFCCLYFCFSFCLLLEQTFQELQMLLGLPRFYLLDFLRSFLDVREIGTIDSAYCSVRHRIALLELMTELSMGIGYRRNVHRVTSTYIQWLLSRSIKVSKLSYADDRVLTSVASRFHQRQIEAISSIAVNISRFNVFVMKSLLPSCNSLRSLDLSKGSLITIELVESVKLHCRSLTTLHLHCGKLPSLTVVSLFTAFSELTTLGIIGLNNAMNPPRSVACSGLTSLQLHDAKGCNDTFMLGLLPQLSELRRLNCSGCSYVTNRTFSTIPQHCRGFEELIIVNNTHHRMAQIDRLGILILCTECTNLTCLGLYDCATVTDSLLEEISPCIPHLMDLNIGTSSRYSRIVTNRGILSVAAHCPNIRKLDISGRAITEVLALKQLESYCTQLTSLNLSSCAGYIIADTFETLTELNVSCVLLLGSCFESWIRNCPKLTALHAVNNVWMSDRIIHTIVTHCKHIRVLNLQGCKNLTPVAMQHIITQGETLEEIHIRSAAVTVEVLQTLSRAQCCRRLCVLNCGTGSVTANAAAIAELARGRPSIDLIYTS